MYSSVYISPLTPNPPPFPLVTGSFSIEESISVPYVNSFASLLNKDSIYEQSHMTFAFLYVAYFT